MMNVTACFTKRKERGMNFLSSRLSRKVIQNTMLSCVVIFFMIALPAVASQIAGVPGSPSATTTIDGKQLPPMPDEKFGGKIERNVMQSKPYWPPRVMPPKGAPNVLLIMTDDSGYGVPSTFGGVIPTPALDRLADNGLRYTNFHSTAVCSATRAGVITGRNHHQMGYGTVS
jgi:hypothetical protein